MSSGLRRLPGECNRVVAGEQVVERFIGIEKVGFRLNEARDESAGKCK
jgi:hypothetical protein